MVYLGLHGIVKLALVAAMLRRIRPACPVAAVVLGLLPFRAALDVAIGA